MEKKILQQYLKEMALVRRLETTTYLIFYYFTTSFLFFISTIGAKNS